MPPREQLFWNVALQHLLAGDGDNTAVTGIFDRLAANAVCHSTFNFNSATPSKACHPIVVLPAGGRRTTPPWPPCSSAWPPMRCVPE